MSKLYDIAKADRPEVSRLKPCGAELVCTQTTLETYYHLREKSPYEQLFREVPRSGQAYSDSESEEE